MGCGRIKRNLTEYVDGKLDGKASSEVRAHLESCGKCKALAEKLRLSGSALSSLPGARMSDAAWEKVLLELHERKMEPSRSLFASPRALAAAGTLAVILLAAILVGSVFIGRRSQPGQGTLPASRTAAESQEASQKITPAASDRTGEAGQPLMGPHDAADAGKTPLPVAVSTDNDYNDDSIQRMVYGLEVRKSFARRYRMSDAIHRFPDYIRKLADDFQSLGADGAVLEAMVTCIREVEPVVLPAYAESARFEGRPVYIVGLCAPLRSSNVELTRMTIWVMDRDRFLARPGLDALVRWYQTTLQENED